MVLTATCHAARPNPLQRDRADTAASHEKVAFANLDAVNQVLKDQLADAQQRAAELEARADTETRERRIAAKRARDLESELAAERRAHGETEEALLAAHEDNEKLTSLVGPLDDNGNAGVTAAERLHKQLAESTRQLEAANGQISRLRRELVQTKADAAAAIEAHADAQSVAQKHQAAAVEVRSSLQQLQVEVAALETAKQAALDDATSARAEADAAREELEDTRRVLERTQADLRATKDRLTAAVGEAAARTAALATAEAQLAEARRAASEVQQDADEAARLRGQVGKAAAALRGERAGNAKTAAALEVATARLAAATQDASALRATLASVEAEAVQLRRGLDARDATIKELRAQAKQDAVDAAKRHNAELATLQKELDAVRQAAQLHEREGREARREVQTRSGDAAALAQELDNVQARAARLSNELQTSRMEAAAKESALLKARAELVAAQAAARSAEARVEGLQEELTIATGAAADVQRAHHAAREELEATQRRLADVEATGVDLAERLQAEVDDLTHLLKQKDEEVEQADARAAALQKQVQVLSGDAERFQGQLAQVKAQAAERVRELRRAEDNNRTLKNSLSDTTDRVRAAPPPTLCCVVFAPLVVGCRLSCAVVGNLPDSPAGCCVLCVSCVSCVPQANRLLAQLHAQTKQATEAREEAADAQAQLATLQADIGSATQAAESRADSLQLELDDATAQVARLQQQVDDLRQESQRRRDALQAATSDAAAARKSAAEERRRSAKLERTAAEKQRRLDLVTERESLAQAALHDARQQAGAASDELEDLRAVSAEQEAELADAREALIDLEKELAASRQALRDEQLATQQATAQLERDGRTALAKAQRRVAALEAAKGAAVAEAEHAVAEAEHAVAKRAAAEEELLAARDEAAQLRAAATEAERRALDATEELLAAKDRAAEAEQAAAELRNEQAGLEAAVEAAADRVTALEAKSQQSAAALAMANEEVRAATRRAAQTAVRLDEELQRTAQALEKTVRTGWRGIRHGQHPPSALTGGVLCVVCAQEKELADARAEVASHSDTIADLHVDLEMARANDDNGAAQREVARLRSRVRELEEALKQRSAALDALQSHAVELEDAVADKAAEVTRLQGQNVRTSPPLLRPLWLARSRTQVWWWWRVAQANLAERAASLGAQIQESHELAASKDNVVQALEADLRNATQKHRKVLGDLRALRQAALCTPYVLAVRLDVLLRPATHSPLTPCVVHAVVASEDDQATVVERIASAMADAGSGNVVAHQDSVIHDLRAQVRIAEERVRWLAPPFCACAAPPCWLIGFGLVCWAVSVGGVSVHRQRPRSPVRGPHRAARCGAVCHRRRRSHRHSAAHPVCGAASRCCRSR